MKKILAITLMIFLIFSINTAAFAADMQIKTLDSNNKKIEISSKSQGQPIQQYHIDRYGKNVYLTVECSNEIPGTGCVRVSMNGWVEDLPDNVIFDIWPYMDLPEPMQDDYDYNVQFEYNSAEFSGQTVCPIDTIYNLKVFVVENGTGKKVGYREFEFEIGEGWGYQFTPRNQ